MNAHRQHFILLASLILSFSFVSAPFPAEEPPAAPDSGPTFPADLLDLNQWKGQVVWLDFWASWCAPCRDSFPWMNGMRRKYADQGLVIVAVNLDRNREAADRFLAGGDYAFHHINDPEGRLAEAFALVAMPTSILFDRAGNPVYRHFGFFPGETKKYEQHIADLVSGNAVSPEAGLSSTRTRRIRFGVLPWERDLLALEEMFLDNDFLELEIDDHIYFSKEASSGGRGFGGGGCGCN